MQIKNIFEIIISNKYISNTPFWWWIKLIINDRDNFQKDYLYQSFWKSLNGGYEDINYKWAFESFWGEGSYPPETIVVSKKAYDELIRRINEPPDPKVRESIRKLLERKALWDDDYEETI